MYNFFLTTLNLKIESDRYTMSEFEFCENRTHDGRLVAILNFDLSVSGFLVNFIVHNFSQINFKFGCSVYEWDSYQTSINTFVSAQRLWARVTRSTEFCQATTAPGDGYH